MGRSVQLGKSVLLGLGVQLARRTAERDLRALLQKLRPWDCGRELIRIGGPGDGGYLVPNDLEGIEYCFSPGVEKVCGFENHLADLGIKSFMADYSVNGPPILRPEFTFDKKFLGASDHGNVMTLEFWKSKYLKTYTSDLMLQMDIEGCEYEVLFNTPDALLDQFRIMVIEFHHLDRLFDPFAFMLMSSCFEKILQNFYVAHVHPNGICPTTKFGDLEVPALLEFTFTNKRRVGSTKPRNDFPHELDSDNVAGAPLRLPKCWYSPI